VTFLNSMDAMNPRRLVTLLAAGWLAAGGQAADWPMFRGEPALRGAAPGQLPDRPALLWSFKTQGPVKSSPAIAGGRVFVGSDDRNLYALNLADGKKIWSFSTGGAIESSPLVLGGTVFVGSSDAGLYALDARAGRRVWKYETGDKILGAPNWFVSASGKATNILVGSYDFKLHCVDAASGRSNWVYETSNYINGAPAVADGQAVFGGCDAVLHVISLADGKQVREVDAGAYVAGSVALAFRKRVPLRGFAAGRKGLDVPRPPVSVLLLARGDGRSRARGRAGQAIALFESRRRPPRLVFCRARQGGQLAGGVRRQSRGRFRRRPALSGGVAGRARALVLGDWPAD
jgi:hypothetical protein